VKRRNSRIRRPLGALAAAGVLGALAAPAFADIMACKLSIEDGVKVDPPTTLIVRVSADEYTAFKDGAWGRNYCGWHGGEAPTVLCGVREGAFTADWSWDTSIGHLERHIVLKLSTGALTDRDHNGLEQKGVCAPAPDPALAKPKPQG
jgi:hypothetical protein